MRKNQRTLRRPVEISGLGLFSGVSSRLRAVPAAPGSGIAFVRTDLPGRPRLPVRPDTVASKFRRTAVAGENVEVETIEHVMSAIGGVGIDNLELEIDAAEVPNVDGSSRPFVELFQSAGLDDQPDLRRVFTIREPVSVSDKDVYIVALPNEEGLTVNYTFDYPNSPIKQQQLILPIDERTYASQIAPARTFCTQSEADAFLAQGLGKGASKENTIVVGNDGPNIPLRFPDEYVRHKVLDLLGDLTSLGGGLRAHVVAVKSGHSTNLKLVKRIAELFEEGEQAPSRKGETLLDVREISRILPHRYPMLLIDKVVELDGYRRAVGIKNVTFNEPYFTGHFPDQPLMPGVLQIEAMAQLAGVLLMRKSDNQAKVAVLLALDGVKLRKGVVPGDQLRIEVETLKVKARTGEVYGRATVDGQLVAEANMKFMLMDSQ
jgi:UDP-3-O-[3-hydroxymyristoyl] N-acetylglucosamine deacetylase/3-hydroxyacyl-[acyl-carrier-protein] dehydratase